MSQKEEHLRILREMVQALTNEENCPSSTKLLGLISDTKVKILEEIPEKGDNVLQLLLLYKLGCFLFINKAEVMRSLSHSFNSDSDLIYNEVPSLINKLEFCEDGVPDLDSSDIEFILGKELLNTIFVKEDMGGSIKESYAEGIVSSYSKWALSYNSIYDEYSDDILKLC